MPYKWQLALGAGVAVFLTIVMAWRHVLSAKRKAGHVEDKVALKLATEKPDPTLSAASAATAAARTRAGISDTELVNVGKSLPTGELNPDKSREAARKAGT